MKAAEPWRSWGRACQATSPSHRPEKQASLGEILQAGPAPTYLARGAGRSYGDACLNAQGGLVLHDRLDRVIDLDTAGQTVTCEAGLPLGELLELLLPQGLVLPVLPGTRHATVGGALAADVHGKNHTSQGAMAQHVLSLDLVTPDGARLTCSRDQHPELFWATLGGMGLTGDIVSAELSLEPVPSAHLAVTRWQTPDLEATLDQLATAEADHEHAVAWVDALAGGRQAGRGVVQAADPAPADAVDDDPWATPSPSRPRVPGWWPGWLINRLTVRTFNAAYHRLHGSKARTIQPIERFQFTLDRLEDWHHLYGQAGMVQHQSVLPPDQARAGIEDLLALVRTSDHTPSLAVLKRMGPADEGLLSFPMEGTTLAVDLPARPGIEALLARMDQTVADHDGRVYLAKDSSLSQELFEQMYPGAEAFRRLRARLDPEARLSSSLGQRLGLVDGGGPR